MRISDWSSDVCSSDLGKQPGSAAAIDRQRLLPLVLHCQGIEHPNRHQQTEDMAEQDEKDADMEQHRPPHQLLAPQELARAGTPAVGFTVEADDRANHQHGKGDVGVNAENRSEEHKSGLQSLMRTSY